MKTLYKYVSKEFVMPFFIGLIGFIIFVSVELLYQISNIIIQNHVGFWELFVLIYYYLPKFVVMGIPVGTLLAIFWVLSNFSTRHELMAFQVHGINLKKIVIPFLIMGIILAFGTYLIENYVVPNFTTRAKEYEAKNVWHSSLPKVETNTFFKANNNYFYVKEFDPKTERFSTVLMYRISGNNISVVYAKSAYIKNGNWYLKDGRTYTLKNGLMNFDMSFNTMKLNITEEVIKYIRSQKPPEAMSTQELRDRINLFKKLGLNPRTFEVELYSRFANALGAFIIAFFGVPFSLFFGIKSKSWGVIITFILVVLYQGSSAWLNAMGENGMIKPILASWLPDLIFALVGVLFFLLLDSRLMFKIKEIMIRIMPIFLVIFVLGISSRAFSSQLLTVTAGQLKTLSATEVVYTGGVTIKSFNYSVSASEASIFLDEKGHVTQAVFVGNVVYTQEKRKIFSSKMTVDFQKQVALVESIRGTVKVKNAKGVKKNVYFRGNKTFYDTKSGTSVIKPGYITTCTASPPHYKVESSEIYIVPGDHLIAYNVVMYIFGIPVMYLPQYYYSLTGGKQPMEVSFNYSASEGWYTAVKFNFSPSDSLNGDVHFDSYQKGPLNQGFDLAGKLFGLPFSLSYSNSSENGSKSSEIVKFGTSGTLFKSYKLSFNYQNDVKSNKQDSVLSLSGPALGGALALKAIQSVSNGVQKYNIPYSINDFRASLGPLKLTGKVNGNGNFSLPSGDFSNANSISGKFSWPLRFFTLKSITGVYSGNMSFSSNQPLKYSTFTDASYNFSSLSTKFFGLGLNLSYGAKTGFKTESGNVSISNRIASILKTNLSYNLLGLNISALQTFIQVGGKNISNFDTHNYQNNVAFSLKYKFPIIPLSAASKFSYDFNNSTHPWSNMVLTTSSNFSIFTIKNALNTSTIIEPSPKLPKLVNTKYSLDSKWSGFAYHAETLYDYNSKEFSDISNKFTASLKNLLFLSNFKLSTEFTIKSQDLSISNLNFSASGNLKALGIGLSSKGSYSNGQLQSTTLNFLKLWDCMGLRGSMVFSTIGGFKFSKFAFTLYITAFPEKFVSFDPVTGSFGFSMF